VLRISARKDESVSAEAAAVFLESGMVVRENFGTIDSFEKTDTGVRMNFSKDSQQFSTEAALAVVAIGWMADTTGLNLAAAGVELNQRKFVKVDDYLRTSATHIFAAGDIIGRMMLVPQALQGGFVAATNAVSASPRRTFSTLSKATRRFWPAFPRSGVWRRMAEGFPLRSTEKLSGRSG
jgi:dihydrolipoamide dehydrogenase